MLGKITPLEDGGYSLFVYWSQAQMVFPAQKVAEVVPVQTAREAVLLLPHHGTDMEGRLRYLLAVSRIFPDEDGDWRPMLLAAASACLQDADGYLALDALLQALRSALGGHPVFQDYLRRRRAMEHRLNRQVDAYSAVLALAPENALARFKRGQSFRKLGREDAARRDYLHLLGPDYSHLPVSGMEAMIALHLVETEGGVTRAEIPDQWRRVESGPWLHLSAGVMEIYHHQPIVAEKLASTVPAMFEALAGDLDLIPWKEVSRDPVRIYLHADKQTFQQSMDMQHISGRTIGGNEIHTYQTAPYLLEKVMPHELTHILLARALRHVPRWATEGLAVRAEWGHAYYYMEIQELLAQGKQPRIGSILEGAGGNDHFYYGRAYILVDYLIAVFGWRKFKEYLLAYQLEPDPASILSWYGFASQEDLEKQWLLYVDL